MKKTTARLLTGLAVGLGAWIFRRELGRLIPMPVLVTLRKTQDGTRIVTVLPNTAIAVEDQRIIWYVTNQLGTGVDVSFSGWRDAKGNPKDPAASPDPDPNDPGQVELSRHIPKDQTKKIRGKARRAESRVEDVKYDVLIGTEVALDPIVKLIT